MTKSLIIKKGIKSMRDRTLSKAINHLKKNGYVVDLKNEWHNAKEHVFANLERAGIQMTIRLYPAGILLQWAWQPVIDSVYDIIEYMSFLNSVNESARIGTFVLLQDGVTRIDGIYMGVYKTDPFETFLTGFELDLREFCQYNLDIGANPDFIEALSHLRDKTYAFA
tara:strand:- start:534 stop:1034 length:501 start_codon:yes stop_codon:yes gene_type:complete